MGNRLKKMVSLKGTVTHFREVHFVYCVWKALTEKDELGDRLKGMHTGQISILCIGWKIIQRKNVTRGMNMYALVKSYFCLILWKSLSRKKILLLSMEGYIPDERSLFV